MVNVVGLFFYGNLWWKINAKAKQFHGTIKSVHKCKKNTSNIKIVFIYKLSCETAFVLLAIESCQL